jgi:hypothetical protein
MFEKILAFVERIAVALEKIAATPSAPAADSPAPVSRPRGRPAKDKPNEAPPSSSVDLDTPDPSSDTSFLDDATPPATKLTSQDVRAALVAYGTAAGDALKARQLLKELTGKDVLAEVPEDKYATVVKKAEELTAKLKK